MNSQPIDSSEAQQVMSSHRAASNEIASDQSKAKPGYDNLQKAAVVVALVSGIAGALMGCNVLDSAASIGHWTIHNRQSVAVAVFVYENTPRVFSKWYDILLNNLEFAPIFVVTGLVTGLLLPRKLSLSTIYFSVFFVICYDALILDKSISGSGMTLGGVLPIALFVACHIPIHIASVFIGHGIRHFFTERPTLPQLALAIVGVLCIPALAYLSMHLRSALLLVLLSFIAWCLTPRIISRPTQPSASQSGA